MINYGVTLKRLVLQGDGKKDATLIFEKGLNLITGASDTGKSFAFECINYILGARDIPDRPVEASDYDTVLLEVEENSNKKKFTLKRSFIQSEKNKIYKFFSGIDDIGINNYEVLSYKHDAKLSLSKDMLSICNCKYNNVLSGITKGKIRAFSFRDFIHLTMISESRVVHKNSIIYTSDNKRDSARTGEATAFHIVIRGKDYQKENDRQDFTVTKAKLQGQVEELYNLCSTFREENTKIHEYIKAEKYEDILATINKLREKLDEKEKQVAEDEERYKNLKENIFKLSLKQERLNKNVNKFVLLKKNYESDIERLKFIEEAHIYADQLIDIKCPLCNNSIKSSDAINVSNKKLYYMALGEEKKKLSIQLIDLKANITEFHNEIDELNKDILSKRYELEILEQNIKLELSQSVESTLKKLQYFLDIRDNYIKVKNNDNRISTLNNRIDLLNEIILKQKKSDNRRDIEQVPDDILKDLCKYIKELLVEWKFIGSDIEIEFDFKKNDIRIGDKEKASFGKGARAVINTAFIISILQYTIKRGLSHPSFVIIDSPLTTFKEKDKKNGELNEEVEESIKQAFFRSLSDRSLNYQIIVLDNVDLDKKLENINYCYFTGNEEINRKGFIP